MKKLIVAALLSAAPLTLSHAADANIEQRVAESKAVVQEFMGKLVTQLKGAMKEGGPTKAIEVCNKVAPGIAAEVSKQYGWDVGRTSLKLRNPANAPDAWEEQTLKKFDERRANGESPATMAYYEVVEENGEKKFRFMKAIGMPPLSKMPCLKCHGENIAPNIKAKLDELYPNDQATGYKPGQIRGAFTITQPM